MGGQKTKRVGCVHEYSVCFFCVASFLSPIHDNISKLQQLLYGRHHTNVELAESSFLTLNYGERCLAY